MALIANISVSQSVDGKILTFTDSSDWTPSGLNISLFTRTVKVYYNKDATGALIATRTFTGNTLTLEYPITQDQYYSYKYEAINGATEYSQTVNYGFINFEFFLLEQIMSEGCGCDKTTEDNKRFGFIYLQLAKYAFPFGLVSKFNQHITSSNKWLLQ